MTAYKEFIRNNVIVMIGQLLSYAKGIILIPIIIKTVGETIYGGYTLINSIIGLVFGISSLGVGFTFMRYIPSAKEKEARRNLYYPQFSIQLINVIIFSLILILMYPLLARVFIKGEVTFSPWLIAPYLIFYYLFSQSTSYFRYTHRVNYYNYATIAYPYIHIALIFLIYYYLKDLSINLLFASLIISSVFVGVPLFYKIVREIGFKFTLPNASKLIKDIKLGYPLVVANLVDIALGSSDRFIIAALISVTSVGYYAPAYALGSLIIFLPKVSGVVLPPLMCKSVDEGNKEHAQNMVNYMLKGFLLIAIPFVFGCAALAKPILTLLANKEVALQAYWVTPVIALGMLFYGLNIILYNIFFVQLRTKALLKINFYNAVINIVLNICLLYIFKNILFAAIASFISYLLIFIFVMKTVSRTWAVSISILIISRSIIASIIMYAVISVTTSILSCVSSDIWFSISQIVVGIMIYFTLLLAMKTFTPNEIKYLKKTFLPGNL